MEALLSTFSRPTHFLWHTKCWSFFFSSIGKKNCISSNGCRIYVLEYTSRVRRADEFETKSWKFSSKLKKTNSNHFKFHILSYKFLRAEIGACFMKFLIFLFFFMWPKVVVWGQLSKTEIMFSISETVTVLDKTPKTNQKLTFSKKVFKKSIFRFPT